MMMSTHSKASAIELLPGELMRQIHIDEASQPNFSGVPPQQSRIVLPDDTDENQIEQIDVDPRYNASSLAQQSVLSTPPSKPEPVVIKDVKAFFKANVSSKPESIPVHIKQSNQHSSRSIDSHQPTFIHHSNQRCQNRSSYSTRHNNQRFQKQRNPPASYCDTCCRQSSQQPSYYEQYYWPSHFKPNPVIVRESCLPSAPEYYVNRRPTFFPMVPIIW